MTPGPTSDLIFAVFSGVPGTAELRWHGPDCEEAQRTAIENSRAEPLVSIRVLPPDWSWKTTVFRWEHLPGEHVIGCAAGRAHKLGRTTTP